MENLMSHSLLSPPRILEDWSNEFNLNTTLDPDDSSKQFSKAYG